MSTAISAPSITAAKYPGYAASQLAHCLGLRTVLTGAHLSVEAPRELAEPDEPAAILWCT
jgi:hypothetical protein